MIMHGDLTTNAGHPLTLGTFQPGKEIEGTVDPVIANRNSEMAMVMMKPIPTEEMLASGMTKEVETGISHLKMTNPADGMLGGNPGKITSSTGSELTSSKEETRI